MLTKEQLKGTYIRYTPDITEDIFDKIIKRLGELGITEFSNHNTFSQFSDGEHCYLTIASDSTYYVHSSKLLKEISISDILGDVEKPDRWLVGFPEEGSCKFKKKLANFLSKTRTINEVYSGKSLIAWNAYSFWYCNTSSKEEYKWDELKSFVIKNEPMKKTKE